MTARPDVYLFFALACAITWALDVPIALAFVEAHDPCLGNLVFVGTVTRQEPVEAHGRAAVRSTFIVDLLLVDISGAMKDGAVEVVLPADGHNGEVPVLAVGERWSLAMNRVPGRADPFLLGHAWSPISPEVVLPSAAPIRTAWSVWCSEAAVNARRSR